MVTLLDGPTNHGASSAKAWYGTTMKAMNVSRAKGLRMSLKSRTNYGNAQKGPLSRGMSHTMTR
jgi:hypothetical protein